MSALYVYGIVDADQHFTLGELTPVGTGDTGVPRRLSAADLPVAAVVSDAPADLRGKRRDLLAHEAVLDTLAAQGSVLPMRFGVVSPDEEALLNTLRGNALRYVELLRQVDGRVELNVKAMTMEQEFIGMAAKDPSVTAARRAAQRDASRERQIQLGQAVAAAVKHYAELSGERLMTQLQPHAIRTSTLAAGENYALNAAFLVERDQVERFVEAVEDLQKQAAPALELVLTGPLPPYSFVGG